MRVFVGIAAGTAFSVALTGSALAGVVIRISKYDQSMRVYVNGELEHVWSVSTARRGYRTPVGSYRPTSLSEFHRSSIYNNAPMPYSIFFKGGYAIHGSYAVSNLGNPASHGCIRLHPANARDLYDLVRTYGPAATRIVISQ